jgi:hypothetical protein
MEYSHRRILTVFPTIPTEQPRSVEELNEVQREIWIDFCDRTRNLLNRRRTSNTIQTVSLSVMIVMFLILIILIIVLFFRRFKR